MSGKRIVLTEDHFNKLTAGEVVKVKDNAGNEVEIILQDIGFVLMQKIVEKNFHRALNKNVFSNCRGSLDPEA